MSHAMFGSCRAVLFAVLALSLTGVVRADAAAIERLFAEIPADAREFSAAQASRAARRAVEADEAFAKQATLPDAATSAQKLANAERIAKTLRDVDERTATTLKLAASFSTQPADAARQARLQAFVATVGTLIDLSGRLRYTANSALDATGVELVGRGDEFVKLCRLLAARHCRIGASALAPLLLTGVQDEEGKQIPLTDAERRELLGLISTATPADALGVLADFARTPGESAEMVLLAAEAIRRIGLPQDQLANGDVLPAPEITAAQLLGALNASGVERLSAKRRADLLAVKTWLKERAANGVAAGDSFFAGGDDIRPGDWLLMRNPSPYNLFSDLAPGLFTHVGIVTAITGPDGRRRIVVVDLPERGTALPATPFDAFIKRTLHYAVLRHEDAVVAARMAEVAAAVAGRASQFDLNFRIRNVERLKGKVLDGKLPADDTINTYCAGLLLLCAQETERPRSEFFPIAERGAGGNTPANLGMLGLSIGEEFVSPTGPLFSPRMKAVAWREPLYSPPREIEQAVFDHFARGMRDKKLAPTLDQFQALRLKLAEGAKKNPALAQALAKANNVSEEIDLVAAAKAAAVVETVDEIAYRASGDYLRAIDAVTAEDEPAAAPDGDAAALARREAEGKLRTEHAGLRRRWESGELSTRELRIALVAYYRARGCGQIDARFFAGDGDAPRSP